MPVLEAKDLVKNYEGKRILKCVSLSLEKGEALALIGPTGTGKTTTIRLLDLLEKPDSGTIIFDGTNVSADKQKRLLARRRMAYVQQKPTAFSMNVFDNVACGLKWRGCQNNVIRNRVEGALELVGMEDYAKRDAKTLSGGETQRVAIARALVTKPEVLFLDEPTANLDPHSTLKIEEIISMIVRERKTAVALATHNMGQGQRLAGRIGVMLSGSLLQIGSPNDIFCSPDSRQVAEFVGIDNIIPGEIKNQDENLLTVDIYGHLVQAVSGSHIPGKTIYILVRPEDITLSLVKEVASARNVLTGTITRVTPSGPLMRVELDCGFMLLGVVTRSAATDLNLHIGQIIFASFKATATHAISRLP